MLAAEPPGIVASMNTLSELPPAKAENAGLASTAREDPFTRAARDADDEHWDDSAEAPMHREPSDAYADSIFPGYPLS